MGVDNWLLFLLFMVLAPSVFESVYEEEILTNGSVDEIEHSVTVLSHAGRKRSLSSPRSLQLLWFQYFHANNV